VDWLIPSGDWSEIFVPDTPLLEIIIRGTIMYLALFALLRFVLKRQAGTIGITDLLVVVLIADAAQNAMSADYKSVADGILLVFVIVFWAFALDWLGYHSKALGRFVHPPPLPLVEDGQVRPRNLRRELITEEELMSQLREQGVEDIAQVKRAQMEGDGRISVVTKDSEQNSRGNKDASRTVT
jgi:uncharacterized membrane protein YcaP (DUF421 family)